MPQSANINPSAIRTDPVRLPLLAEKNIQADMLRTDLIHPVISGNKWFKLRFYLEQAVKEGKKGLLTFGGAWSNHIHATAAAGQMKGLTTTGIIRGEKPAVPSLTLREADACGMHLYFVNRGDYRTKSVPAPVNDPGLLLVPEGGYGETGARGAATMLDGCNVNDYTHILCAVGTGTMLAGIQSRVSGNTRVTGISVMKNNFSLDSAVAALLPGQPLPVILHSFHAGGYARHNPALLSFMNFFFLETGIPTDFVYTGKLCHAFYQLTDAGYFPSGSRVLLIHSGGLQGNRSLAEGTLIF